MSASEPENFANDVPTASVTAHAAEPMPGPDGAVHWWGSGLTDFEAMNRLLTGGDIVVRGPERRANRNKARELMQGAYGGFVEDPHHQGRMALPHFHPPNRVPEALHAFYESPPRHAKKRK